MGGRGKWIKILNTSNNKSIYRKIYGAGDTPLNCDQIELDYDSSKDLDIADKNNCTVKLFKATCIGQVIGHCKHPDPKYRIPLIIGIIGLVLGIISLVVTFWPICCKY